MRNPSSQLRNKNIWVLGTSLYLSKDGGVTFTSDNTARGIHVDHHSLWIDLNNGNHVILGNDGGKVLRELEGDPKAGLHSVRWDLQSVRPTRGSGNNQQRSNRGRRGGTVPSGKYLVTLQVDDQEFKTVLTVEDDPTHPPQTN